MIAQADLGALKFDDEQVAHPDLIQKPPRMLDLQDLCTEWGVHNVQNRGLEQEFAQILGLSIQYLAREVIVDVDIDPSSYGDLAAGLLPAVRAGEEQSGDPAASPLR